MEFQTLNSFMLHTETVIYVLMVLSLLGILGIWIFLNGMDDEE